MSTRRRPEPGPWAREFEVTTSLCTLSGLVAEPADGGEPRALIVALHGMQMHAGYFDTRTAPGLSFMETASNAGYRVWSVDRPGTRASRELAGEHRLMRPQADLLLEAVDSVVADGSVGAGVFVLGHSYGGKLALAMLGRAGDRQFLGLDVSACGYSFARGLDPETGRPLPGAVDDGTHPSWGPLSLYPPGARDHGVVPAASSHPLPVYETPFWPADLDEFAPCVHAPVRFTLGDHEIWWTGHPDDLAELRGKFIASPRVETHLLPGAGHNIGLGWAAADYHRDVLAFADECVAASDRGASGADLR